MASKLGAKSSRINSPVGKGSPFQATKLWNQMIRNFRDGVELKKRRWKMKTYENTFSGQDAVNWFHFYLRSNQKFGDHVTRAQAKMLLQKFFENGIFEDARGKEKFNFEDDNHLYRFSNKADMICQNKTEVTTQRSVTNLLRSVSVRRKPPSLAEASCEEERSVSGLKKGMITRSQSMKCAYMSPQRKSVPSDAVKITPIAQDLNAFKINSTERQLKENSIDVGLSNSDLKSIKSQESTKIEQPNFVLSDEENYTSILQDAGIDNCAFLVTDATPWDMPFQRTWSLREPKGMKYRHKFVVPCDEEDALHEPSFVMNKSIRRKKLKRVKSSKLVTGISYVKGSECGSPSKKAKVENAKNVTQAVDDGAKENIDSSIDIVPGSYLFERKKSLKPSIKSDTSLNQMKKNVLYYTKSVCKAIDENGNILKDRTLQRLKNLLQSDHLDELVNLSVISGTETERNIRLELKTAEIPEWTLSAMKYLVEWPDSKTNEGDKDFPKYDGFECDVFRAVQDHYESTLKEPLMTYNMFKLFDACSGIIGKDHSTVLQIFQHISLLIPTWNRKQIYLILRFMDKVAKNLLLKLSKDLPNRELVIGSFHQTVIRNKELNCVEKDKMTSLRAVTFLMDNHEQILAVPEELRQWDDTLKEPKHTEGNTVAISKPIEKPASIEAKRPVSLCVQYTKEEYSKQAIDCTRQALIDLLGMITNDCTLHPRIKKKRLKEFKKNYPDIYQVKFPEDNISTCSTTSQRTLRIRQAIRPFFFNKRHSDI